eukprot:Anaeramoba_flamelloidesa807895_23.p3 GENE.a807895_23~~a807895_23.p3  ORF type:complete len:279 (-),score=32.91 a807895_23:1803-2639(-)
MSQSLRLKHCSALACIILTVLLAFTGVAMAAQTGTLKLVSVGIGDRDNMTLRAHKAIVDADLFLAMHPEQTRAKLADLIGDKPLYDAGHGLFGRLGRRGNAEQRAAQQDKTRKIIREAVASGKHVVILDYGDSTIYGPQTGYLKEFADLNPVIVPGISSFNAANAALKCGITGGSQSRSVIITAAGGSREGYKGKDTLTKLAETQSTMVFFTMGLNLSDVVKQLKTQYDATTPMAIVLYAGSSDKEQVIRSTLDTITTQVDDDKLPFEHLIYVGDFLR